MKVIQIFLIGCLLLVTVLGGCQGKTSAQYSTATPEGTARCYLEAYFQMDAGKIAELWVEKERKWVRSNMVELFKQFESIAISDTQIEMLSQTEDTAEVKVQYYHNAITKKGVPQSWYPPQKLSYKLSLVKQRGEWLIEAERY